MSQHSAARPGGRWARLLVAVLGALLVLVGVLAGSGGLPASAATYSSGSFAESGRGPAVAADTAASELGGKASYDRGQCELGEHPQRQLSEQERVAPDKRDHATLRKQSFDSVEVQPEGHSLTPPPGAPAGVPLPSADPIEQRPQGPFECRDPPPA